MPKVKIRLAKKSDIKALCHLRYHLYSEDGEATFSLKSYIKSASKVFLQSFNKKWLHIVVEIRGELVGCASIYKITTLPRPYKSKRDFGYLTNAYVKPEYRNKKIGSKILKEVIKYSKKNGFESIIVWPSDKAKSLYKRAGFSQTELSEIRL